MADKAAANLVHQTTTGTGTGNLTLSTVNGKQSFNTAFGNGVTTNVFVYFISNQGAAEWEYGTGHMSDATTLVRDTVIASTNSNTAVSFSAGTKDVSNDVPAASQVQVDLAQTLTNKTINASNNTVSNLATSMFAANVIDTDGTLAANSDTRIASQKAVKTYAQPLDADLTTIAGLTPTTNNFMQAKSSAWASRTPTQVTADLDAVVGDSGSGGTKGLVPAPGAGDAAANKYLKANGAWATVTASGSKAADQQVFTSSGTWTKPSGFSSKAYVLIECWSAGGGAARGTANWSGGGGGYYKPRWILLSSLGSTETVTIGAGGVGKTTSTGAGGDGGNTTFGSWVTSYGGQGGQISSPGKGGGPHGVGGNLGSQLGATTLDAVTECSGGDGTHESLSAAGRAVYGGGGGGSKTNTAGGASQFASSGASAVSGTPSAPGFSGGGAASTTTNTNGGDGGVGKCVVTVFDGA